jgi:hypothetical protein
MLRSLKASNPKPRQMIGLVRLHAYRGGVFNLVDVPQKEAKKKRLELSQEGWVVTHTEFV